jgi:hypothetical protein
MRNYQEYIARKKQEHKEKFDSSDLASQFIKYYENHKRIEIEFSHGKVRGFVGITTGWKPCFLLMKTKRSISSSYTLREEDKIIRELNY